MQIALQRDKFLKKPSSKIEELCKFTMMNFKIEQHDALAPLLDDGTAEKNTNKYMKLRWLLKWKETCYWKV